MRRLPGQGYGPQQGMQKPLFSTDVVMNRTTGRTAQVETAGENPTDPWRAQRQIVTETPALTTAEYLSLNNWFNVVDYGAKGDGVTDDTAAIQAGLDAVADVGGGVLVFPQRTFIITARLDVAANTRIMGFYATLQQTTDGEGALNVLGDNVEIEALHLVGPQFAALDAGENAILCVGADVNNQILGLRVNNCRLETWGRAGVWMEFVREFSITNTQIEDVYYAGILGASVRQGHIGGNTILNVVGTPLAYGIALTRNNDDSLSVMPRSGDVEVIGNVVRSVTNWEGLDTHGGERITFQGNVVRDCQTGIAIVAADDGSNVETFAPVDVIVSGNMVDSETGDGSRGNGIVFTGPDCTPGSPGEVATGAIVGNLVRNHGDETNSLSGGIVVYITQGVVVSNNVVINPSPAGIVTYHTNEGFVCESNVIIDAWSNTLTIAMPLRVRSEYNVGLMGNNVMVRGAKSATNVMTHGVRFDTATNNGIGLGPHDFTDVATPISGSTAGALRTLRFDSVVNSLTEYQVAGTRVVNTRKTGWATATGTATRTTFDTATVTTAQLAQRVKALIDDLHGTAGHGLIGT